jgi:hypothetical protein
MNHNIEKLVRLNNLIGKVVQKRGKGIIFRNIVGISIETQPHKKEPQIYPSAIVLLGQGNKSCYVGDQAFDYGAGDILVTMLPIPVETVVTEASADKPLLAVAV